jgi:hypothetical protein
MVIKRPENDTETYCFAKGPMSGHEIRINTITFGIKLLIWTVIRLAIEVSGRQLGLGTSPGHQRVLTGISVGILVGHMTHGSGSPVATGRRGSGYGFYGGGYPP